MIKMVVVTDEPTKRGSSYEETENPALVQIYGQVL